MSFGWVAVCGGEYAGSPALQCPYSALGAACRKTGTFRMDHPIHLLIVDAQNDFCDLPLHQCPYDPLLGRRIAPALPVAGAHADLQRLAALIRGAVAAIDDITLTLDSHHLVDIAHPPFWRSGDGRAVAPFTTISAQALRDGEFRPADPRQTARAQAYVDALEARGRYTLMVWPVHCQIGSWGQALHAEVLAACNGWEARALRPVQAVRKGEHPFTEHYSALQAEVPDPAVPDTALNHALLARLDAAETILVAGQASSHCVKATVEDLAEHLPSGRPHRLVLMNDCMSPVAGFEAQASAFIAAMGGIGVRSLGQGEALRRLAGSVPR